MKLELISELMREVSADLVRNEAYYHNAFSAHGAAGKTCPAISGKFENCMIVIAEIIKEAIGLHTEDSQIAIDVVVDTMLSFKQEKLGLFTDVVIMYWPNLPTLPITALDDERDDFGFEG